MYIYIYIPQCVCQRFGTSGHLSALFDGFWTFSFFFLSEGLGGCRSHRYVVLVCDARPIKADDNWPVRLSPRTPKARRVQNLQYVRSQLFFYLFIFFLFFFARPPQSTEFGCPPVVH